jgi:hypothetical protein
MSGQKSSQSIESKAKYFIYGHGRGWCFTPRDLQSLGSELAILQALLRLQKQGHIRRLSWGLYEYPREHKTLGPLPPDIDQIVRAITRKAQTRALPSGALAANLLGLSDQVPAKAVYLTEGLSKRIRAGNREIIFKRTTPKNMATAGTLAGLVIQALKHIGKSQLSETMVSILKKRLTKKDRESLIKQTKYAPAWIQKIMLEIAGEKHRG